jgi:hypothetical protein
LPYAPSFASRYSVLWDRKNTCTRCRKSGFPNDYIYECEDLNEIQVRCVSIVIFWAEMFGIVTKKMNCSRFRYQEETEIFDRTDLCDPNTAYGETTHVKFNWVSISFHRSRTNPDNFGCCHLSTILVIFRWGLCEMD